jgi:phosphate transport system substrate-binding protein
VVVAADPGRIIAIRVRRVSRTLGTLLAFALLALSRPLGGQTPAAGADGLYAVIVHPSTTEDDLTLEDLRRVFLGQQQFWPGGRRVVLFVQPAGTVSGDVVLEHVYRMSESEYKRYWIARTFRDEVAAGPKIVSSTAMARRLTASVPGAIAVIPVEAVDGTVKVLSIDRRFPGAGDYPLRAGRQ